MGLGGYLTWTAVAREICNGKDTSIYKIVPCELHGNSLRLIKSEVFRDNPIFLQDGAQINRYECFPLQLNNPKANYCTQDTPTKAYHRYDKHIIEQICEFYEIDKPALRCELYFSQREQQKVDDIKRSLNEKFVAIEPHSKTNYTPNRAYPFEKWQKVVNELSKHTQVVQVGPPGKRVLENVIDLTNSTSFKEAALLLKYSQGFVSTEGGLVHAATAVDAKSVVVMTGYQSMKMVAYPQNINIDISSHGPCGMKVVCPQCSDDADKHDYNIIIEKVLENLNV